MSHAGRGEHRSYSNSTCAIDAERDLDLKSCALSLLKSLVPESQRTGSGMESTYVGAQLLAAV